MMNLSAQTYIVLEADYVVISGGQQAVVRRLITHTHLDSMYSFHAVFEGGSVLDAAGNTRS